MSYNLLLIPCKCKTNIFRNCVLVDLVTKVPLEVFPTERYVISTLASVT